VGRCARELDARADLNGIEGGQHARAAKATAQRKTALSNQQSASLDRPLPKLVFPRERVGASNGTGPSPCPIGQTGAGGDECTACEVGKYKAVEGSAECTDCSGIHPGTCQHRGDEVTNNS
jgi:hypothetical protein